MSDDLMFLLKADIGIADSILQRLDAHREEQSKNNLPLVKKIAQHLLGTLPDKCQPLLEGTFHLIYILHYGAQKIIVKMGLELPKYTAPQFTKTILVHQLLQNQGIFIPALYTKMPTHFDEQYLAMEFIEGVPAQFDKSAFFEPVVEHIGRQLAAVHQIEMNGFGPIQLQSDKSTISARHPEHHEGSCISGIRLPLLKWADFIHVRLDEHLSLCHKNHYLSSADYTTIHSIFKELDATLNQAPSRLLHGDLGPKNVLVTPNKSLCFIDWEDALSGDPIFDIAMWGSFMQNQDKLDSFIRGYYQHTPLPEDFYLKYFLYQYRILLAKTVHRYRFDYCRNDVIPPAHRLKHALYQLREALS